MALAYCCSVVQPRRCKWTMSGQTPTSGWLAFFPCFPPTCFSDAHWMETMTTPATAGIMRSWQFWRQQSNCTQNRRGSQLVQYNRNHPKSLRDCLLTVWFCRWCLPLCGRSSQAVWWIGNYDANFAPSAQQQHRNCGKTAKLKLNIVPPFNVVMALSETMILRLLEEKRRTGVRAWGAPGLNRAVVFMFLTISPPHNLVVARVQSCCCCWLHQLEIWHSHKARGLARSGRRKKGGVAKSTV